MDTLGQDQQDASIVRAIIAFAKALNLTVTREGVETAQQLALPRVLGCDHGQGHRFARPASSEAITALPATAPRW